MPLLKVLLQRGFKRSEAMFLRFTLQTVVLGAFLASQPESVSLQSLPWVGLMGVLGFAVPVAFARTQDLRRRWVETTARG